MEKEFYTSLEHLAGFYGFKPIAPVREVYPYNLHIAFKQAQSCMERVDASLQVEVVQDEGHTAAIAVKKTFDTGCELYYIPVQQVCKLLADRKQKRTGRLLASLFGILYRKGVACHRGEGGFLESHYDMMLEWLKEQPGEWEEEEYLRQLSDCYAQAWYSDQLFKQIRHPYPASKFAEYLRYYQPQSETEQEIAAVCQQFYQLFTRCPDGHFHRQIHADVSEDEDGSELAYPDYYLSFFWSDRDSTYENLVDAVNSSLQECSGSAAPESIQLFDKPQYRETHDFYFEWRFLLLIDALCYILFNLL